MKARAKIAWSIVIAVLLLLVFVVPAAAAAQGEEIPTFDAWLKAASGPLISVIVGVLLSFAVEWWPAYDGWASRQKRLFYFGLCLIVPVLAACLRGALGYVAWSFDPLIWHAIWNGVGAGGAGTIAHSRCLSNK